MSDHYLSSSPLAEFEQLKRLNEHGAEYWCARDLQPLLGYAQWRRFEDAVRRAMASCEQSGNKPGYHFANAGKMIDTGKGAVREVEDFHLSRFACYLIAQNGDPRNPPLPTRKNTLRSRREGKNCLTSLRPMWSASNFANRRLRNSSSFRAQPVLLASKIVCSAFFTMPDTKVSMAVWV